MTTRWQPPISPTRPSGQATTSTSCRGINSECVDLIYLDPPFNSNQDYAAPVGDGAVHPNPAGVSTPRAHGGELPLRWRGLAIFIVPPAGDGAVHPQTAGVSIPRADGGELPGWCRGLAIFIVPSQQATEPSTLKPQVCPFRALTEANSPYGGVAWPYLSSPPQQATEPSTLKPQVWTHSALTEANSPSGGVAWPYLSSPQQATEPSILTPQVWSNPALTEANSPSGGVASPSSSPQQATEPST